MRFKTMKRLGLTAMLLGGSYLLSRGCSCEQEPGSETEIAAKVKQEPTFAEQLEKKVGEKRNFAAAYLNVLREGMARNPEMFTQYLAEQFKKGDKRSDNDAEKVFRTYNSFTELMQTAISQASHPRDGYKVPPLSEVEPRLNYVCSVSGCSYYLTLHDRERGKDYLITLEDELGSKRVSLRHYSSLREEIDKREPKLTMVMPGKMEKAKQ